MARPLLMPKFGFTQEESEIVAWLVEEGTAVERGDPLVEVTTDKVNMEVESPADGIIAGIRAREGETVPVTSILAYILAPGEALPEEDQVTVEAAVERVTMTTTGRDRPAPITPVAARLAASENVDLQQVSGSGPGGKITRRDVAAHIDAVPAGKVRATPAARRLARETGVDLASVSGSGPRGRVQVADVKPPAMPTGDVAVTPGVRHEPLSPMRRAIGANLQASWQQAPHINFRATIEMTAVQDLCRRAADLTGPEEAPVGVTAVILKAVAGTLSRHPQLNAHLVDDALNYFEAVSLGLAVALKEGLIVPVLPDAGRLSLAELARLSADVVARARTGKLRAADRQGATFTVSNLGMYGIDDFTAVINPPEVAILAVGRIRPAVVAAEDEQAVVRPVATFTLAVDHRAVDGALAAAFMRDLRLVLEQPALLAM